MIKTNRRSYTAFRGLFSSQAELTCLPLKMTSGGNTQPSPVTLLCKTSLRTNSGHFGQSSDSSRPSDLLAQGLPALGIVLFSCLSYMTLNYICSYLYTCLYDVARFPSLYIDLALSPHSLPSNIIFISSSLEDVLSSPMDHTPIRSIPATSLRPSAVGSPLRGLG